MPPELRAHPLWARSPILSRLPPDGFSVPVVAVEADALRVLVAQLDAEHSPDAFSARAVEAALYAAGGQGAAGIADPALGAILRDITASLRRLEQGQVAMQLSLRAIEGDVRRIEGDVRRIQATARQDTVTRRNRRLMKSGNPMAPVESQEPGYIGRTFPEECPHRYRSLQFTKDVARLPVLWLNAYLRMHALPEEGDITQRRAILVDFLIGRY